MRLEGDGDLASLGHGVLGRVLGVFMQDALFLVWFRPVLFKQAAVDPLVSRSGEGLDEDAAVECRGLASCPCQTSRPGQSHLSTTLWYSSRERSSGWGVSTVGRGLPASMDTGKGGGGGGGGVEGSSTGGGEGCGSGVGSRGVDCRRFDALSRREDTLVEALRFFSIVTAGDGT